MDGTEECAESALVLHGKDLKQNNFDELRRNSPITETNNVFLHVNNLDSGAPLDTIICSSKMLTLLFVFHLVM